MEIITRRSTPFVPYLEGMRGVAALYVVLFHMRLFIDPQRTNLLGPAAALLPLRGLYLLYGYYAVSIFIVISGFVLSLPIAVRGGLAGGVGGFLKRRARRLLPAYYAALTLAVPLYLLALHQNGKSTTLPSIVGQWVLHALMLQDLSSRVHIAIDAPLWSVAVEVQIYILFAVLLLPTLQRFGAAAYVGLAFLLGLLPTIYGAVRHLEPYPLQIASPWFLGLFALGSMAAFVAYGDRWAKLRALPFKPICIVAAGVTVWLLVLRFEDIGPPAPWADIALGFTFAAGMVAVAKDTDRGESVVANIFGWGPLLKLGAFSYSLYLIHYPIVWVVMTAIRDFAPLARLLIGYLVVVPAIVGLAYLFARVFEFPYLTRERKRRDGIEASPDHPEAAS
jgi:peptidoglycan/LPS O-acetylase OafA/YrhL